MRLLPWLLAASATSCVSGATHRLIDETFEAPVIGARAGASIRPADAALGLAVPLTRAALLAAVVARDPGLAARAHRVRAMLHASRAEGSLPAPEVSGQIWNLPLARPYALGEAQMYMFEVRQSLPAPGSLDARARAMAEEAQGELADLATREENVVTRASLAYADYVHGTLDHLVHTGHLALLAAMLDAARGRYTGGGATLADVARIEVEQARTRRALARIDGDLARARAQLTALLLRPPGAPLGPPADLAPETVGLTVDALLARAASTRGALRQARARIRAARARADAAHAEASWPTFTVGLSYWQDPQQRPGVGTAVGMTLPWLWGGTRARLAEAREREAAEVASAREAAVVVQGDLSVALARLRGLERELGVLRGESGPAAERALDAVRAAYVAGRSDLLAWIDAARQVLDVQMEEADVTAELARAAAELEQAVGGPLPRTSLAGDREGAP